ncbi:MAG TPA: hypothetical protein VHW02_13150 [Rhizomicrobium sp.]|jgi:hypothetical protein|nr:hypothetical protein [Rhizomicrobium sp.]
MNTQVKNTAPDKSDLDHLSLALTRLHTANSRYYLTMVVDILAEGLAAIENQSEIARQRRKSCRQRLPHQ